VIIAVEAVLRSAAVIRSMTFCRSLKSMLSGTAASAASRLLNITVSRSKNTDETVSAIPLSSSTHQKLGKLDARNTVIMTVVLAATMAPATKAKKVDPSDAMVFTSLSSQGRHSYLTPRPQSVSPCARI
jgi:hypothetical protein